MKGAIHPGGAQPGRTERYTLLYPIDYRGRRITELTLRRPSPFQLARIRRLPASYKHASRFIAMTTGLPPAAVDLLDLADFNALADVLAKFMGFTDGKH